MDIIVFISTVEVKATVVVITGVVLVKLIAELVKFSAGSVVIMIEVVL